MSAVTHGRCALPAGGGNVDLLSGSGWMGAKKRNAWSAVTFGVFAVRWPDDYRQAPFFYESMDVTSYAYDG